jgi:hypothetical protein
MSGFANFTTFADGCCRLFFAFQPFNLLFHSGCLPDIAPRAWIEDL